jgi:N-methylhydantoinase A
LRDCTFERLVDMRYTGQSYEIRLPLTRGYLDAFHAEHQHLYGYADRDRSVEVVNLRLLATGKSPKLPNERWRATPGKPGVQRVRWNDRWLTARRVRREHLGAGTLVRGPAIVTEFSATTLIPPGWRATMHTSGHLEILHGR